MTGLEGNEPRVIGIGRADTAESTGLHVPSLAAVVTGDLACNEVHAALEIPAL